MKIYTTDKTVLEQFAADLRAVLHISDYKGIDIGEGYVIVDNKLKVFVKGSAVDLDQDIVDITNQYM